MTPERRDRAISIAALVALFLLVTLSAPRWSSLLRRPAGADTAGAIGGEPAAAVSASPIATQISARLFFAATDRPGLVVEQRGLPFSTDMSRQVRLVAEEVFKGPSGGLRRTFGSEARVLDTFVTPRGVAIVNVSKGAMVPGRGTDGELLAVYSLVNSLVTTFPSLKKVQILVESSPTLTLGGHVDLSRPLAADATLLAVANDAAASGAAPRP